MKKIVFIPSIILCICLFACGQTTSEILTTNTLTSVTTEESVSLTSLISETTSNTLVDTTSSEVSKIISISEEYTTEETTLETTTIEPITIETTTIESITTDENYKVAVYSHHFLQGDFEGYGYNTKAGSVDINGLTWTYDAFAYLGQSSDGIQIGSNKQPQKDPWTISTSFGENVKITSISIGGKHQTGTLLTIYGDSLISTNTIKCDSYEVFNIDDLEIETDKIKFTFSTTAKALYLDLIRITFQLDKDSKLSFSSDEESINPAVPGQNGVPATKYIITNKEEYYRDIDFNASKNELFKSLNSKISTMTQYSYGQDSNILLYVDAQPNRGQYMYGLYDGDDIIAGTTGVWNKEHVWACAQMDLGGSNRPSSGTKNKSSDLHNLRVCCQNGNGLHGDKFFDNENTSNTFYPNIVGISNESHLYKGDHRGDVARILFYMATRYTELHIDDKLDINDNYSMGKLSTLLERNILDPVDDFEIQRNNRIFEYQGNRNPYIDYPELANKVFENY